MPNRIRRVEAQSCSATGFAPSLTVLKYPSGPKSPAAAARSTGNTSTPANNINTASMDTPRAELTVLVI
ncbi:MAG: hypothetical protein L0L01_00060 [Bifidobacterium crudilactis]|nr:hypothetical protein [Bifidobacterium crudilactis]